MYIVGQIFIGHFLGHCSSSTPEFLLDRINFVLFIWCILVERDPSAFFSCSQTFTIWTLSLNYVRFSKQICYSLLRFFQAGDFIFLIFFVFILRTKFICEIFPVLIVGIEILKQHDMILYNKHMILCNSLYTSLILIFYFLGLHKLMH